jgi:hypothetical protein
MSSVLQDIQFAVRTLRKDVGFATAAILTLVLCLGANSAIFTIVNGILLRTLPVPDADRILLMSNQYPKGAARGDLSFTPDYYDRLQGTTVFEEQAMFATISGTVGISNLPERVAMMLVTRLRSAQSAIGLQPVPN